MFKVEVSGLDSLDKDYEEQLQTIGKAIPAGLSVVGNEMAAALQRHVKNDVYAAYKPKSYKRTGEMGDISNMTSTIDKSSNTLAFEYRFGTESARPYFKGSDQVIAAVQDSDYLWNVGNREIPERPFWDNFFNELFSDNRVDEYFASGMNQSTPSLRATAVDGSVILTGEDMQDLHEPLSMHGGIEYDTTDDDDKD